MSDLKICREDAVLLLKNKYTEILDAGEARYPKRSDFSDAEVNLIKSFFGPWPRALEAAGIKPQRDDGAANRSAQKRIRAKRERNRERREQKKKQRAERGEA